jgi:hypothetical protein
MSGNNPPLPIRYFIPGEIVFRVDHDQALDPTAVIERLRGRPEIRSAGNDVRLALEQASPNHVIQFERKSGGCLSLFWYILNWLYRLITGRININWTRTRYFSLVFTRIQPQSDDPQEQDEQLLEAIQTLDQNIARFSDRPDIVQPSVLQKGPSVEDDRRGLVQRLRSRLVQPPVFRPHAASFSWYNTSAQGQATGTGGPGTRPVPLIPPPQAQAGGVPDTGKRLDVPITSATSQAASTTVDIYILDTVPEANPGKNFPDLIELAKLPERPFVTWLKRQGAAPAGNPNPLVMGDFSLTRCALRNWDNTRDLIEELNDPKTGIDIGPHPYDISAHGLFIADIICDVAEAVPMRLHLIEVLNKWGVGTMEMIANGLKITLREIRAAKRPTVVNCSFMMLMPRMDGARLNGLQAFPIVPQGYQESFIRKFQYVVTQPDTARRMREVLEPIFDTLAEEGACIVAAAGNEWATNNPAVLNDRPIARYPAAFDSVIGVGALKDTNSSDPARYSNRSDEPASAGMAAFGGDVDAANPLYADPNNSIDGLYIGPFPTPPTNPTFLAHWAGTSFAAPIVAASLAIFRAQGMNCEQAQNQLNGGSPQASLGPTRQGERTIKVNRK